MSDNLPTDRSLRAVFTVTVETRKGPAYFDHDRFVLHAVSRIEGALEGSDDIRGVTVVERPLSPDYEHPECGFHWHGKDGMDIPMRDGQPVCPRCELAKVQKQLDSTRRRREEVGAECKRRGKTVLERGEEVRALKREIDGVRRQLGAEILRANTAEGELRRLADEAQQQPAEPPEHCALMRAHVALAEQAGRDQATLARVRRLYESGPLGTCCAHLVRAALNEPAVVAEQPAAADSGEEAGA